MPEPLFDHDVADASASREIVDLIRRLDTCVGFVGLDAAIVEGRLHQAIAPPIWPVVLFQHPIPDPGVDPTTSAALDLIVT